jgi:hypothetical protein
MWHSWSAIGLHLAHYQQVYKHRKCRTDERLTSVNAFFEYYTGLIILLAHLRTPFLWSWLHQPLQHMFPSTKCNDSESNIHHSNRHCSTHYPCNNVANWLANMYLFVITTRGPSALNSSSLIQMQSNLELAANYLKLPKRHASNPCLYTTNTNTSQHFTEPGGATCGSSYASCGQWSLQLSLILC